jgi:hypothetical protein
MTYHILNAALTVTVSHLFIDVVKNIFAIPLRETVPFTICEFHVFMRSSYYERDIP